MGWIATFYRSTIGRKVVMAVTGLWLVVFVVVHMSGNLLAFRGSEALNHYSKLLQSNPAILWSLRVSLLAAALLHIHSAWSLTRSARGARPTGYARHNTLSATPSSRLMRWGGVLLLGFIIFHLLHLTTGTLHPDFLHGDVYGNLAAGFAVRWVAAFYVIAMIALGLHLHHGVWSVFQTLGIEHARLDPARRRIATLLAIVVSAGFAAIPLAFLFGLLR